MGSLIKPGGLAFVSCVIHEAMSPSGWGKIRRKVAAGAPLTKNVNPWEHLNYFSPKTLVELMRTGGFEPLTVPLGRVKGMHIRTKRYFLSQAISRGLRWPGTYVSPFWVHRG
jgi:hypothetical protein